MENGYANRIIRITPKDLPLLAEVYQGGVLEVQKIVALQPSGRDELPPLFVVEHCTGTDGVDNNGPPTTVDLGQVTTIWTDTKNGGLDDDRIGNGICEVDAREVDRLRSRFPVQFTETAMQDMYASFNHRANNSGSRTLTKKQINKVVQGAPNESTRTRSADVLRKLVKTGKAMVRLVDSSVAADYLFRKDYASTKEELITRSAVGAKVLAEDALLGGRFKRMPCLHVASEIETTSRTPVDSDDDDDDDEAKNDSTNTDVVASVTLVNGGWLLLDAGVRAGTEARKFVERNTVTLPDAEEAKGTKCHDQTPLPPAQRKADTIATTSADERIVYRLECLAMGDVFSDEYTNQIDQNLEVDVREALRVMQLPETPEGARKALVRTGRWSTTDDKRVRLEPWSAPTLEAARWYESMDQQRREGMDDHCNASRKTTPKTRSSAATTVTVLEGRVDLTRFPCVCVDTKSTRFRDDAIGIRPRKQTGRKVLDGASKWEVLIHIADVSDLYVPNPPEGLDKDKLELLRKAPESRGTSRYDLPLGPMHLIPPVLSGALGFRTQRISFERTQQHDGETIRDGKKSDLPNRCVTLWVYLHAETGRVLDAGIERTLVSSPYALSYEDAERLFEQQVPKDHPLYAARAVLTVVERELDLWNEHRRTNDKATSDRDARLKVKELVAKEKSISFSSSSSSSPSFRRSRGHRLVDAALSLYSYGLTTMLRRAKAPIPRASGSGVGRGGRLGTAPLRRYIDGMAQRQALAVLCKYGGPKMTTKDCKAANAATNRASERVATLRPTKPTSGRDRGGQRPMQSRDVQDRKEALRLLEGEQQRRKGPIPAIATGKANQVVIRGIGAVATCHRVTGSLKPGQEVTVHVNKLVPEKGILDVSLASQRPK